ncbi:MAG: hypothetical protein NVSMB22_15640 [Chloroflexota bacterium]
MHLLGRDGVTNKSGSQDNQNGKDGSEGFHEWTFLCNHRTSSLVLSIRGKSRKVATRARLPEEVACSMMVP